MFINSTIIAGSGQHSFDTCQRIVLRMSLRYTRCRPTLPISVQCCARVAAHCWFNAGQCAMSILPSSLDNLDNPDKLTWVWPSTLQTVNRWRHNEYSWCSHPSFSYSPKAHLLSRSDQWSDCQTWCGWLNTTPTLTEPWFFYTRVYRDHWTANQCCFNVDPTCLTMAQQQPSILYT